MTDENVLLDDGAMDLTFGKRTVTVCALKIQPSSQWVKRVKNIMFSESRRGLSIIKEALCEIDVLKTLGDAPGNEAKILAAVNSMNEKIDEFTMGIDSGMGDETAMYAAFLNEHSPEIMTKDILNEATVHQIENAFRTLYAIENPTVPLQTMIGRRTGMR